MLELVGLTPAAKRKFKGYSLGMKQRLGIAAAMLGNPQVLILDEPANGLDPEGIRWMRDLLKALAAEGRTVLVSSHLLVEMQLLADDVVIIAAGQLIRQGPVDEVLGSMAGMAQVRVRTPQVEAADRRAAAELNATVTPLQDGALLVTGVDAPAVGPGRAAPPRSSCTSWPANAPTWRQVFLRADGRKGGHPMNLVRAELLKIRHHEHLVDLRAGRARRCGRWRSLINWLPAASINATRDGRPRACRRIRPSRSRRGRRGRHRAANLYTSASSSAC